MNNHIRYLVICSLLLVSLTGLYIADEPPGYLVYIQGGKSSITNGSDKMMMITVKDIIPFFHITEGKMSSLIPVEQLTSLTYPMSAALVFSGVDNETTFMVKVANLSLTDGNNVLTLQVEPLQYYEGDYLKSFDSAIQGLEMLIGSQYSRSAIYIEATSRAPDNTGCVTWMCCVYAQSVCEGKAYCECMRDDCLYECIP
jgi:hypothetical protein